MLRLSYSICFSHVSKPTPRVSSHQKIEHSDCHSISNIMLINFRQIISFFRKEYLQRWRRLSYSRDWSAKKKIRILLRPCRTWPGICRINYRRLQSSLSLITMFIHFQKISRRSNGAAGMEAQIYRSDPTAQQKSNHLCNEKSTGVF